MPNLEASMQLFVMYWALSKSMFNFCVNVILQLLHYGMPEDCESVQQKGTLTAYIILAESDNPELKSLSRPIVGVLGRLITRAYRTSIKSTKDTSVDLG